jgi:NarL family two-component system response regulator LiaR
MNDICEILERCNYMKAPKRGPNPRRATHKPTGAARLLLVDDQKVIRIGLREILQELPEICILGEATNGNEAVSMAIALRPDIIVMDISMPELDGIDATIQIIEQLPQVCVLGFSADSDQGTVHRILAAGARGFISKACDPAEVVLAIKQLLSGERFVGVRVKPRSNVNPTGLK